MLEWDAEEDAPITKIMVNETGDGKIRTTSSPLAAENNPYFAELAHFLDCLETGKPFRVTPRDALQGVKVELAAIESVRTGQPIDIATFEEQAA